MSDFFNVGETDVIMHGITVYSGYGSKKYIVYIKRENGGTEIRVNTDFREKNGLYKCLIYYDRKLCNTAEEFVKLTVRDIESQAYGSYMDGAR